MKKMHQIKRYPFSMAKHAHDIELVKNRAYNLAHDAFERMDMDEYDRLMKVHDDAENVLTAIMDNAISFSVTMLPGPVLAKAREMVMIADSIRSYKTNS